jgi:hypothetical protein
VPGDAAGCSLTGSAGVEVLLNAKGSSNATTISRASKFYRADGVVKRTC